MIEQDPDIEYDGPSLVTLLLIATIILVLLWSITS